MVPMTEIVKVYSILRRYKDHSATMKIVKAYFWPRVADRMTKQEFVKALDKVVNKHCNQAKQLG